MPDYTSSSMHLQLEMTIAALFMLVLCMRLHSHMRVVLDACINLQLQAVDAG